MFPFKYYWFRYPGDYKSSPVYIIYYTSHVGEVYSDNNPEVLRVLKERNLDGLVHAEFWKDPRIHIDYSIEGRPISLYPLTDEADMRLKLSLDSEGQYPNLIKAIS